LEAEAIGVEAVDEIAPSTSLVKTRWSVFFVLRNADFVKFRNASEPSWEKFCSYEFYTESKWRIMADQVLWRAAGFTAFLRFLTSIWCCEPGSEGAKTEIRNSYEKSVRKEIEITKNFKIKKLDNKK